LYVAIQQKKLASINSNGALQQFGKTVWAANDGKGDAPTYTLGQLTQGIPLTEQSKQLASLGNYAGMKPTELMKNLYKEAPQLASNLARVTGYDEAKVEDYYKQKQAKATQDAKPITASTAPAIIADPNETAVRKTQAQTVLDIDNNQKFKLKENELKMQQAIDMGDPAAAARLLVDGTLTLGDLRARKATPAFITQVTTAAQALAAQQGNPTWSAKTAEAQVNAARGTQNVSFFGSAGSLLRKGGTLDLLASQGTGLGNSSIPMFNTLDQYISYHTGNEKIAGFPRYGTWSRRRLLKSHVGWSWV
jgi:hypothetical protein